MTKATWKNTILAKSDDTVVVDGTHYFPRDDVDTSHLRPSDTTSTCPWKGAAHYYNLAVDGDTLEDGAFFYDAPTEAAEEIEHRIAFWKDAEIVED